MSRLELLRTNADFRRNWWGQALSAFGANLTGLALPLIVLHLTGSPVQAGAVATARLVALGVARLAGGALADRLPRRPLLVWLDVAAGGLWAVPAILAATGGLSVGVLLVVAVADGVITAAYSPAASAALTRLVGPDELPTAMALTEARTYTAGLAGPVVGGVLFVVAPWLPLAVDAATYLVCAALTARIGTDLGGGNPSPGLLADIRGGLTYVFGQPVLRALLSWAALMNFATAGAFFGLLPVLRETGLPAGRIGVLVAVTSLGALGGAFLAPRLTGRRPDTVLFSVSTAAVGLVGAVAIWPVPPVLAVALTLLAAAGPVLMVTLMPRIVTQVPDHLMGRTQSALLFAGSLLYPFGALVVGWTLQSAGPRAAYGVITACLAGCLALCLSRPVRTVLNPHEEKSCDYVH